MKPDLKEVKTEPTEAEALKAADRARLQACAPEIRGVLDQMTSKVVREAMKRIDNGTLDPDLGYNLWLEYYAAYKMGKKLLVGAVKG
jgi:hypothetical protein